MRILVLLLITLLCCGACKEQYDHKGKTALVEVDGNFLYKEDFGKFMSGLEQAISYINQNQEYTEELESGKKIESESETETAVLDSEIKIDIDFE